jgi:acetyl esterase/lipase
MFAGEVDDLEAAVRALAGRSEVDPRRLYVFGQGAGGHLAALLALRPGVPAVTTVGVGALYRTEDLLYWGKEVPFDVQDAVEVRMRLLYPNLRELRLGHIAYVGEDDVTSGKAVAAFAAAAREVEAPFRVERVRGDEKTSLGPAMARFMESLKISDYPKARP